MNIEIRKFADLLHMSLDEGFPVAAKAFWVRPDPDESYDTLSGATRLRALETALSSGRGGWNDNPAERANDWLRQPGKSVLVLSDLEATGNGGNEYPLVWNRMGWDASAKGAGCYGCPAAQPTCGS